MRRNAAPEVRADAPHAADLGDIRIDFDYAFLMKLVYTSSDQILVAQLKYVLESEGIGCVTRNEVLGALSPEIPFTESFPELWIQKDEDLERAEAIKRDWKAPLAADARESWECSNCHERSEAQFSSCWKCGTPRGDRAMV